jgi:DNA polymerase-1
MTKTLAVWDCKSSGQFENTFDCYIAEALLLEGRPLGSEEETLAKYKVKDLEELAEKQRELLAENPKLEKLFFEIEQPLAKVLWGMEMHGIILDTQKLTAVGEKIDGLVTELKSFFDKETGGEINLNSPAQLGSFLAEKVGVPLSLTKTGKYATNEAELSKFANQFPIISNILKYRGLTKLRSTYVESLIQKVDENSLIHTTYNQVMVSTGRLGSLNPNLQNIPVTSEIGQEIKSCFIAKPKHSLVSFDYSQQELRILAHLTQEPALIEAFKADKDVHVITASKLFNVDYDNVTKEQRHISKTINFGIIYGMSSYGMSASLNIPQEAAEEFIKQFYVSYPNIKTYYDNYLKNAKIHGCAETLLGRKRYVFEDPKRKFIDNSMRRVLMNYPIQGTAAEFMKKAMVDVDREILTKYKDVALLLTIHDDLVFEIPDGKLDSEIIPEIREVMTSVYPLAVPVTVDVKVGKEWGSLEKFIS